MTAGIDNTDLTFELSATDQAVQAILHQYQSDRNNDTTMKSYTVLPYILLLISGPARQSSADDPLPPGLDHAIANPKIPMIVDVTIVKFSKAGHGEIRVNRIYKPAADRKSGATRKNAGIVVPKVVRGYGYEGSDKVAPLSVVTGRGQTRFLMFLDGDLLFSTYNNRFPIRERKDGLLEVGIGFNGGGGPWKPLRDIVRLIPGGAEKIEQSVNSAGTKVLVAFDPAGVKEGARQEFQQGLQQAEVQVLSRYDNGRYLLLDCGRQTPASVLAKVPYHAGAIVFRDGKFMNAVASHDNRRIPGSYAVLRRGSSAEAVQQMERDVRKFTRMEGVVVKRVNAAGGPEAVPAGNPVYLKLTPGKDRTLLDIFILAEARFAYLEVQQK